MNSNGSYIKIELPAPIRPDSDYRDAFSVSEKACHLHLVGLTLCMLRNFSGFLTYGDFVFIIKIFEKFFQEYH